MKKTIILSMTTVFIWISLGSCSSKKKEDKGNKNQKDTKKVLSMKKSITKIETIKKIPVVKQKKSILKSSAVKIPVDNSTGLFDLSKVLNIHRLKGLTKRQKKLLAKNGFFLAHQPKLKKASTAAQVRTARGATHLFHIYERNDYIRFPTFVTADVAVDMTHAYFTALLQSLEYKKFIPLLKDALKQFAKESDTLLSKSKSKIVKNEIQRSALFWAVALRLLEQSKVGDKPELKPISRSQIVGSDDEEFEKLKKKRKLPRPKISTFSTYLEPLVKAAVKSVMNRSSALMHPGKNRIISDKMIPRGNYTSSGALQRYFRAMSWLGLIKYDVKGEKKDIKGIIMLSRSLLANPQAAKKLKSIIEITSFIVGKPDSTTLDKSALILKSSIANARSMSVEKLLAKNNISIFEKKLQNLPSAKIPGNLGELTPHVCAIGKRPFNDSKAMSSFIEIVMKAAFDSKTEHLIPALMGGLGSAAVQGSKTAFNAILKNTPNGLVKNVTSALKKGVSAYSKIKTDPYKDAYHGTLFSLNSLLWPHGKTSPKIMRSQAWMKKSLYTYCSGWAELRHDTILYGKEMGAECDDAKEKPGPCWVEPVPKLYTRLIKMVKTLDKQLKLMDKNEAGKKSASKDPSFESFVPTTAKKTKSILNFLQFLNKVAKLELANIALDDNIKEEIMTIGGDMEWILATLAESHLLDERDKDMAVVADVFNFMGFRGKRMVVQVGIGDPDLIYVLIPTPKGYVVARGGVMSYREFIWPSSKRLTDEKWREKIGKKAIPDIPKWIKEIYAEPIKAILLQKGKNGRDRCGMNSSGSDLKL